MLTQLSDPPAADMDETALWESAVAGSVDALGTLLTRHSERLRATVTARGLRGPDVSDAVQETFIRALSSWRRLKNAASLASWLDQIARNVATDWLRRRARGRRLPPAKEPVTSPPTDDVHDAGAVDDVPGGALLRMRYVEGLSGPQIAERLGLPLETVKKRLQRARVAALDWLKRRAGGSP